MFPVLLDLGTVDLPLIGEVDLALPTYGVLFALSALVAWGWYMRRGRALGLPEEQLFNSAFWALLGGIVGAKLALIVVDWQYYAANPGEILGTIRSAGVLMGGVVAGAVAFVVYARRHRMPVLTLTDAAIAPVALGQAIGRLGCFAAGCCYGVHADEDNPFAVTFTDPEARDHTGVPLDVPLVPVQLIQLAADLLLAGILTLLWRRRIQPPGSVLWSYMVLYGLSRGTIEFWRGDAERGLYFGDLLSTSQLLSLAAIVVGAAMLIRGRLRTAA